MKTCRQVAVTFFYLVLFLLVILVYPVSVVGGEQQEESNQWWPSTVIYPPEFEAFFRVLDEKTKGIYVPLQSVSAYDPRVAQVEPEMESIFGREGELVGLRISVSVTNRPKKGYVYRQFRYHGVWGGSMADIFYDLSFLKRSKEENKKLAFVDEDAYWDRVAALVPNVRRETADAALKSILGFTASRARGLPVTELTHLALNQFAECIDAVFRRSFEPFVSIEQSIPKKLILIFDYDPTGNRFLLTVTDTFIVPSPSGISFSLPGRERFISKVFFTKACSAQGASNLAEMAFRTLSELLAGEKR